MNISSTILFREQLFREQPELFREQQTQKKHHPKTRRSIALPAGNNLTQITKLPGHERAVYAIFLPIRQFIREVTPAMNKRRQRSTCMHGT
ncbi:hypothetical protein LF934_17665 [Dickeya dadantii]|uniref:hypothetical protein n=1 Tax=Dickeya dadantii TaxID=204038 RepID=UPI001CF5CF20|nr:hypothetical protein [Dickeya dadantii]MCA7014463.1 hypothetical protein [Dickeya dadantii]